MSAIEVPLLDLRAQYERIRNEIEPAMRELVESQRFIMGEPVERLEEEIAATCGARLAAGCSSGSEALLLALLAHGVGPGDEVVLPTYTFFATAGSVSRLGARPIFADIDPATYNVTAATLETALGRAPRARVLIPVHLYGQAADIEGIEALAASRDLRVVEDAAQAIGSVDGSGRRVGARGHLTCLSFFPSKNLGAFGDAGMVLGGDPEEVERVRLLRLHGGHPKYYHAVVGLNARIDALQAVVLRVKLRHLEGWHAGRIANADHYEEVFRAEGAADSSVPLEEGGLPLRFPFRLEAPSRHIFNQFVVRVPAEHRDALRVFLGERKIGTDIYYPIPLHLQECFRDLGGKPGDLPHAEKAATETLALPIYPELDAAQREHVTGSVLEFLRGL